jgi:hypothetical protein
MFRKDGFSSQILRSKQDKQGKKWNFSYWHTGIFTPIRAQRLFFWDDDRTETGVLTWVGPATRRYTEIAKIAEKLAREPNFRRLNLRDLRFPLDRYYGEFGSFADETQGAELPPEASKKIQSV